MTIRRAMATKAFANSSIRLSWTMRREAEVQRWPVVLKALSIAARTARSRSASWQMIIAFFPPISQAYIFR